MSTSNQSQIFFEDEPESPAEPAHPRTTGILPSQEISNLIARGNISASRPIDPDHIQPASLDLRLGDMAHRVRASFLPGPNSTVESKIKDLRMSRVDLTAAPSFRKRLRIHHPSARRAELTGEYFRQGQSQEHHRTPRHFHAPDYRLRNRVRHRAPGI